MKITIKHLDHRNIIILSMFSEENNALTTEFKRNSCNTISEGQIMDKGEFYAECRKMQRSGCNDKSIERVEV